MGFASSFSGCRHVRFLHGLVHMDDVQSKTVHKHGPAGTDMFKAIIDLTYFPHRWNKHSVCYRLDLKSTFAGKSLSRRSTWDPLPRWDRRSARRVSVRAELHVLS